MSLQGLIAAPHTPFRPDGELWLDQVQVQAEHLVRTGVSGAFVGGSTGEGISLTTDERLRLVHRWCEVAQESSLQVIAHVGHNCQRDAIDLATAARQSGAAAVAAFAPSYFRPDNVAELIRFLRPIAAAAEPTPFYYYDIPVMTRVELPVVEVLKAASEALPSLVGVKATNMDLMSLQECLAYDNGRYNILFGVDENLLTVLPLGVKGAVGSTYNLAAPLYLQIIEAFHRGDWAVAQRLQLKSVQLIRCLAKFGFMPAAKYAMSLIGVDCGPCRSPLSNLSTAQKESLKTELETLGFFEWQTLTQQ